MLPFITMTALAAPALPALPLVTEEMQLDNGIRVAAAQVPGARLVAVEVRVLGGSAEEGPGESGLAHLVEHIGFGGSRHAPLGAYDTWLAEVGADNNAWTEHDGTSYTVLGPPEALALVLFLESDRLGWLAEGLTEHKLDNQRAVVLAEAMGDAAAAHGRDLAALNAAVFPVGHPYHRPVMGDVAGLAAFSPSDVLALHQRSHAPGRVSVAIAGPAPPGETLAEAHRWLSEVPGRTSDPAQPPAPLLEPEGPSLWIWQDAVREDRVFLAWPTVPRGHPDEPVLDLIARMMTTGADAPLKQMRRLQRSGIHGVDAWTINGRHGGLFVVQAQVRPHAHPSMVDILENATARVRLNGTRLHRARVGWHADAVRSAQGVSEQAHLVAACLARALPADCAGTDLARYAAVTEADVRRVRARWLQADRRTALLVVDEVHQAPAGATQVELP